VTDDVGNGIDKDFDWMLVYDEFSWVYFTCSFVLKYLEQVFGWWYMVVGDFLFIESNDEFSRVCFICSFVLKQKFEIKKIDATSRS